MEYDILTQYKRRLWRIDNDLEHIYAKDMASVLKNQTLTIHENQIGMDLIGFDIIWRYLKSTIPFQSSLVISSRSKCHPDTLPSISIFTLVRGTFLTFTHFLTQKWRNTWFPIKIIGNEYSMFKKQYSCWCVVRYITNLNVVFNHIFVEYGGLENGFLIMLYTN